MHRRSQRSQWMDEVMLQLKPDEVPEVLRAINLFSRTAGLPESEADELRRRIAAWCVFHGVDPAGAAD